MHVHLMWQQREYFPYSWVAHFSAAASEFNPKVVGCGDVLFSPLATAILSLAGWHPSPNTAFSCILLVFKTWGIQYAYGHVGLRVSYLQERRWLSSEAACEQGIARNGTQRQDLAKCQIFWGVSVRNRITTTVTCILWLSNLLTLHFFHVAKSHFCRFLWFVIFTRLNYKQKSWVATLIFN